jgi:hypothetical protein
MSAIEAIVLDAPSVTVAGVTVQHNTEKWRVCTNRHPECNGNSWGWIEGAPGHVCWSNSKRFNSTAAGEMVKAHHEWLEQQKSPAVRLVESRARWTAAKAAYEKASEVMAACDADLIACAAAAHPLPKDRPND